MLAPVVRRQGMAGMLYLSRSRLGDPSLGKCGAAPMSQSDFSAPIDDRYFEDYLPGFEQVYGPLPVTEAEVVEFGRRFDPQDMHMDPNKAA